MIITLDSDLEKKFGAITELLNKIFRRKTTQETAELLTNDIIKIICDNDDYDAYTLSSRFKEICHEFFCNANIRIMAIIGFVKTLLNNKYMSNIILKDYPKKLSRTFMAAAISSIENTKSVRKFIKEVYSEKYLTKDIVTALLFRFNHKIIAKIFKEYNVTDRDLLNSFKKSVYLCSLFPYINLSKKETRKEYFSRLLHDYNTCYYYDHFDTLIDGITEKNYTYLAEFVQEHNLVDKFADPICNYLDMRFYNDDRSMNDIDLKTITKLINSIDNMKMKIVNLMCDDDCHFTSKYMSYFVRTLGISERYIFNRLIENGNDDKLKEFLVEFPEYKNLAMLA